MRVDPPLQGTVRSTVHLLLCLLLGELLLLLLWILLLLLLESWEWVIRERVKRSPNSRFEKESR